MLFGFKLNGNIMMVLKILSFKRHCEGRMTVAISANEAAFSLYSN